MQTDDGSEDCLFLDIYAPPNTASSSSSVMVFFHGGCYIGGDSSSFHGQDLIKAGDDVLIVVV